MSVSTLSFKFMIPSSAVTIRLVPSNRNGFVTTAIVRAPCSFAISAMIGAAPVPVPPPSPQVIKTISQSRKYSFNFSRDSSAACLPISGLPPAPKPRVKFSPICTFV